MLAIFPFNFFQVRIVKDWTVETGHWIRDTGYWKVDTGHWIRDTGYGTVQDTGHWIRDSAGYGTLDIRQCRIRDTGYGTVQDMGHWIRDSAGYGTVQDTGHWIRDNGQKNCKPLGLSAELERHFFANILQNFSTLTVLLVAHTDMNYQKRD